MSTIALPGPPPIDGIASLPSLRTLGTGAQQAAAGNDSRFLSLSSSYTWTANQTFSTSITTPSILASGSSLSLSANGGTLVFQEDTVFGSPYYDIQLTTPSAVLTIFNQGRDGVSIAANQLFDYIGGNAVTSLTSSWFRPLTGSGAMALGYPGYEWGSVFTDSVKAAASTDLILARNNGAALSDQLSIKNIGTTTPALYFGDPAGNYYIFGNAGTINMQGGLYRLTWGNGSLINASGSGASLGTTGNRWSALYVAGDTDGAAQGPIYVKSVSTSTIGASVTLDATTDAAGHSYSFISTGSGAGVGGGHFSVFKGGVGYVLDIDNTGNVTPGNNSVVADLGSSTNPWKNLYLNGTTISNGGTGNTLTISSAYSGTAAAGMVFALPNNPATNRLQGSFRWTQGSYEVMTFTSDIFNQDNLVFKDGQSGAILTQFTTRPSFFGMFTSTGAGADVQTGNIYPTADATSTSGASTLRWATTWTTKIAAGSSNTTGHTVPNIADDTLALLAASQTLTNKTLGTGTVIGANVALALSSNYAIGSTTSLLYQLATQHIIGGSSNSIGHTVPNISDDTFALLAASQTLTNKTLGTGTTISANVVTGTSGTYSIGSTTNLLKAVATTKLIGGGSNTSGHTVPNVADDTLALLAASQTLTNKTLGSGTTVSANVTTNGFVGPNYGGTSTNVPTVTWTNVTFNSPWSDAGGAYPTTAYFKDATGRVHVRIATSASVSSSATIFTLPAGYRPAGQILWAAVQNTGAYMALTITSGGAVTPTSSVGGAFSHELSFMAAA